MSPHAFRNTGPPNGIVERAGLHLPLNPAVNHERLAASGPRTVAPSVQWFHEQAVNIQPGTVTGHFINSLFMDSVPELV